MHARDTVRSRIGSSSVSIRRRLASAATVTAVAALALAGATTSAAAADGTWYVDQANGTDVTGCGIQGEEDACATIGAAVAQAAAGGTVEIAPGDYVESLTVAVPLTLQGVGEDAVTLTSPDGAQSAVIVDAEGTVALTGLSVLATDLGSPSIPLVRVEQGRTASLTGVTLQGPGGITPSGTGVLAAGDSTVTLDDVTLTGLFNGAMVGTDLQTAETAPATLTMTSSTVESNATGIVVLAGSATITNSLVRDNAFVGLLAQGSNSSFDVSGTTLSGNAHATNAGSFRGGVLLFGGSFTGTDVVLERNHYGVMADGGTVTLRNSTVTGSGWREEGVEAGAGISGRSGDPSGTGEVPFTLTLENSAVSSNTLGIAATGRSDLTIAASIITQNRSGGIVTQGDEDPITLEMTDSIVAGNGHGTPGPAAPEPAGLILNQTHATITDTDLRGNRHGLLAFSSQVAFDRGTVAEQFNTGIWFAGTDAEHRLEIDGTAIVGNGEFPYPTEAGPARGGLWVMGGTVTGTGLRVEDNAVGVLAMGGDVTLTDSAVTNTQAFDAEGWLGEVLGTGVATGGFGTEAVRLVRSEISDNDRHGLALMDVGAVTLEASTVAGNGGLGLRGPDPELGNSVPHLLLAGSTVAANGAGALDLTGIEATVVGSIIDGGDAAACVVGEPAPVDGGFNVFSDSSCVMSAVSSVVGVDTQLQTLAANGGPTRTMLPWFSSPALDLVPPGTSVEWDGGTVEVCGDGFDQRGPGFLRLYGWGCDAGSVELASSMITVTASDATWYEGAFDPEVTAEYAGFLPGDGMEDIDTLPTCSFDVGTAATFCAGGEDDVYSFSYVDGTLTVLDPLVIVTDTLPEATVGEEYSVTLEATGGDGGPYTWGIFEGALPAGLEIDGATGEISGIPQAEGAATFTVFVGDPITQEFTITVNAAPVDPPTEEPTEEPTEQPTAGQPPTAGEDPTASAAPTASAEPTAGAGATTEPDPGLPSTGSDGLTTAATALAVVVLGAALALIARRRRQLG
jgi:LPXTG-motif cell wall-anchored protein